VLYAGKAKDLRRRLAGYRNASRRKAHRKMRTLVRLAASLEIRSQESET
jgi:excinuclease UvrABC nuclease subunit